MSQNPDPTPQPTLPAPPSPPDPGNLPVIVQSPYIPAPPPWVTLPSQVTLLIVLGFFAACTVILYPLMRAIGRRLEGKAAGPALQADVEQLRQRLTEVESMQQRVLELEERVDFAERMLSQRRESDRLGGG